MSTSSAAPKELIVQCMVGARIPSMKAGTCTMYLYKNNKDNEEHLAFVYGNKIKSSSLNEVVPGESERDRIIRGASIIAAGHSSFADPLARVHSACFTGETMGSQRCDCADQLDEAMELCSESDHGVVVYLQQEGRGIGLREKLKAYNLIDQGHDTMMANILLGHPADARTYQIATKIFNDLGIKSIKILTNNPDKMLQLQETGIKISERVPMIPKSWREQQQHHNANPVSPSPSKDSSPSSPSSCCDNHEQDFNTTTISATTATKSTTTSGQKRSMSEVDNYIRTKVARMGHMLEIPKEVVSLKPLSTNPSV